MQGFQRTVLIVAAVMLVICLVVLATLIKNAVEQVDWPPQTATCPDYWLESGQGVCNPQQTMNVGTSSGPLNTQQIVTPQQRCDWAKKNNVIWDGYTDASFCSNTQ